MTRAKKKQPVEEQPKQEQAVIEDVELPDYGWPPEAEHVDPPPPEK
jgi:hypothetical protein